jgi:hypothetical protein
MWILNIKYSDGLFCACKEWCKFAEVVTPLNFTCKAPGFDVDRDIYYPDRFSSFYSVPLGKFWFSKPTLN